MECIIPSRTIKTFAKIISCFSKIGEELQLEPKEDALVLRTINSARSAFADFTLGKNFFDHYTMLGTGPEHCKVQIKSVQAVFRAISSVESCSMRLEDGSNESRLVFELNCKMNIKKVYRLSFEEMEAMHAVFSRDTSNFFVCKPRLLLDVANNFHASLDEISLIAHKSQVTFKSFNEDPRKAQEVLQTELNINPGDFEQYVVNSEGNELTFCVKEFKAVVTFCDFAGQQLACYFDRGGKPMVYSFKITNQLEGDIVMATLVDSSMNATPDTAASASVNGTPRSRSVSSSPSPAPSPTSPMMTTDDEMLVKRSTSQDSDDDLIDARPTKKGKNSRLLWSSSVNN